LTKLLNRVGESTCTTRPRKERFREEDQKGTVIPSRLEKESQKRRHHEDRKSGERLQNDDQIAENLPDEERSKRGNQKRGKGRDIKQQIENKIAPIPKTRETIPISKTARSVCSKLIL